MVKRRTTREHPLRCWRISNGYSQDHVADLAGISPGMVSLIETWQRTPSGRIMVAIAKALGVPVRDIFPRPELPTDSEVDAALAEGKQ